MPKTTFNDFEEFAEAINGVAGRFAPTGKSQDDWWVQFAPVGSLVVQHLQTGSPTAFVGEGRSRSITIGLPSTSPGEINVDGSSLVDNSIIVVNEGQPFAVGAHTPMRWVGITIPVDHSFLPREQSKSESLVLRRRAETLTRSDSCAVASAKSIVLNILANESRIDLNEGTAAKGAEEELLHVASHVIESITEREKVRTGRPAYSRSRVLAKALALIEAHQGEPLFLHDLCNVTRVSERTLRNIFQEYFGVGPLRLLKVNRLREIRAALVNSDLTQECVWKAAARFGVWDLSTFAREYKALFGELPHQTLRSSIKMQPRSTVTNPSWVRYASRKLMEASFSRGG